MSDSGDSEDPERLSDANEIAAALRAGELDPDARFGRKRGEGNDSSDRNADDRTPGEILTGLQSEETSLQITSLTVTTDEDVTYEFTVDHNGDVDVVARVEDDVSDRSHLLEVATYLARNFASETQSKVSVEMIVESTGEVNNFTRSLDKTTDIEPRTQEGETLSSRWSSH